MDGYRTDQVGDARALYARLCRINPANPEATAQLRMALQAYGACNVHDLRDLLISASLERLRSGSVWAEQAGAVAALWQPSSPAQDGSGRPGFWCPAPDVGTVSVRECRPLGYGPPSWTATINGKVVCDPATGRPYFLASREQAQAVGLAVAQSLIPA